jgi:thiol-disulfide isomerase/thioredoxin
MKNIIVIVLSLSFSGCLHPPQPKTGQEGKILPSFSMKLTDDKTVLNTDSIESGKPFVILFFSPYCPTCRAEIRDLIDHNTQKEDLKFYLLTNHPINDLKKFSSEFQLNKYKNIVAGVDFKNYYASYLFITTIPYLAIYDKEKRLRQVMVGKTGYEEVKKIIIQENMQ